MGRGGHTKITPLKDAFSSAIPHITSRHYHLHKTTENIEKQLKMPWRSLEREREIGKPGSEGLAQTYYVPSATVASV